MRHLPSTLLALSLPLFAAACASSSSAGTTPEPSAGGKASASKAADKEADLAEARLSLELAEFGAGESARTAALGVEAKRKAVAEAEAALERFASHTRPHKLRVARLSVDRSARRVRESEQELAQMELMYAEEGELDASTEKTKELVLERSRTGLEFAKRAVELERAVLADLESSDLPRQARELEAKLDKAKAELSSAEFKLAKAELDSKLALMKARRKVEKLEKGEEVKGKGK